MTARKMCYDKVLPGQMHRPHNIIRTPALGKVGAVAPKNKAWVNGSTIRIRFLEGTQAQQDLVKRFAPEWTKHANLKFEFTEDLAAEIRVSFDDRDGAWSYVGTDNLQIPGNGATLNLGWQDEGVILHEFGHMIGLAHEHQNPDGGFQWNEDVVIRELSKPPNSWSVDQIRHNVLNKYSMDQVNGTEFDSDSIMLYAFPAEWTLNGIGTHENDDLSAMDKAFIASEKMYPGVGQQEDGAIELRIGESVEADIGEAGEQDVYQFEATEDGNYTIQTLGSMDAVLALFGPESKTNFIAENDDGGVGLNSLLHVALSKGTYYAQVRHYSQHRTGNYKIMLTR